MGTLDFFLAPVYIISFLLIGSLIKNTRYRNDPTGRYFMPGLFVKLIGSLLFGLIYIYYYKGGDTFAYYDAGIAWLNYFNNEPNNALNFLFTNQYEDHVYRLRFYAPRIDNVHILKPSAEMTMVKITAILLLFGLRSFMLTTIIFGFIAFFGIWAMYRIFIKLYPQHLKALSIAVLFVPSAVFWSGGIMKDTVTFASLGFLLYGSYYLFIKRRKIKTALLLIIIAFFFIAELKGYIILAFIPGLIFWIINSYKAKIGSAFIRRIITPFFIAFTLIFIMGFISQIGDHLGKYSVENLERTAEGFQSWHTITSEGGSGYSLGVTGDFSLSTLMKSFPLAVNVALFRPYLWEAGSIVIFLSAIENLIVMIMVLWCFLKIGIFKTFGKIFTDPFLTFCFIFTIFFAFAVGYTSYNFGALVRYKIPLMPFFLGIIFILFKNKKTENIRIEQVHLNISNNIAAEIK